MSEATLPKKYNAGISIAFAISMVILLLACGKPPPLRELPSQPKPGEEIEPERAQAAQLIDWTNQILQELDGSLSSSLRDETVAAIQPLRQAMATNSWTDIKDKEDQLGDLEGRLGRALKAIHGAQEILLQLGNRLSPKLKRQTQAAIQGVKRAIKNGRWTDIDQAYEALNALYWQHLVAAEDMRQEIHEELSKLGQRLGPALRRIVTDQSSDLRNALDGDSWDDISTCTERLRDTLGYLARANTEFAQSAASLGQLGPSEKAQMNEANRALESALQGNSWADVDSKSYKIADTIQRFAIVAGEGSAPCVRVLSIDGGGIRGIIPAMVLAEIERRAGKPIASLFDLVAGTSTGAILALALTKPDPANPKRPQYAAADLVKFYEAERTHIFPHRRFSALRGLWGPSYPEQGLENALDKYFGDTQFGDALCNVLIPAYEIEEHKHFFFNTYNGGASYVYMREIARAATAAPTYFHPYRVPLYKYWSDLKDDNKNYAALVDGGVFANNPAPYAVAVAVEFEYQRRRKPYDERHPLLLVSLGTGEVPPSDTFEKAWSWGFLGWTKPLIDIVFSDPGEQHAVDLFTGYSPMHNIRFQPKTLTREEASLDGTSEESLMALKGVGSDYVKRMDPDIQTVVDELLRERPSGCEATVYSGPDLGFPTD